MEGFFFFFARTRGSLWGVEMYILLKTLRSRLEVFERESSMFPRRTSEASAAFHESVTWGSDVELEAMESKQMDLALSLPLSPEHVRASSPVEFAHDYL